MYPGSPTLFVHFRSFHERNRLFWQLTEAQWDLIETTNYFHRSLHFFHGAMRANVEDRGGLRKSCGSVVSNCTKASTVSSMRFQNSTGLGWKSMVPNFHRSKSRHFPTAPANFHGRSFKPKSSVAFIKVNLSALSYVTYVNVLRDISWKLRKIQWKYMKKGTLLPLCASGCTGSGMFVVRA